MTSVISTASQVGLSIYLLVENCSGLDPRGVQKDQSLYSKGLCSFDLSLRAPNNRQKLVILKD